MHYMKESIEVVLSQSNFNKIRNIENERILNNEDKIFIDIRDNLISEIDKKLAQTEFIQTDLSERLAAVGLLPMFGSI